MTEDTWRQSFKAVLHCMSKAFYGLRKLCFFPRSDLAVDPKLNEISVAIPLRSG